MGFQKQKKYIQLFIQNSYLHCVKKQCITLLFLVGFLLSFAQEPQKQDFKVGLVLSGGGAKGLAHIGALKVIDESGIQIDYIGGTSMGAIIGALYASGYTAKQLDSIFRNTDFETVLQDELPRTAKTFYEKNNSERYAITLPFNNFKITIPQAISKGQNVYNMLSRLLFHVSDVEDFNDLPIPFFCIATNLETGEPVVFNRGHLANSISASGAFPSLFNPIEINGKLLLDGGVVNNYPIDELRSMGADIVIGVDVQDGLDKRDALKSATNILLQINNYNTVNDMKLKVGETDIYIKPDISNYTVVSFKEVENIIKKGYDAGLKNKNQLDSLAKIQKHKKRIVTVDPPSPDDEFLLEELFIDGNEGYSRAYVRGKLRYNTSENITFKKFASGINNLSATNNFEKVSYNFNKNKNGGQEITMNLRENKNELFFKVGIHYDKLYNTAGIFNITKKRLLFNDDVFSFDFILGDQVRYNFDYYLDKGFYWSLGLRSSYNSFRKGVNSNLVSYNYPQLQDLSKIDLEVDDLTNQIYLQTIYREELNFGGGIEHKFLKMDTETISDENNFDLIFENSNFLSVYAYLTLDTYDSKYFPTKGFYFNSDLHFYFYSDDFTTFFNKFSILKAKLGFATPIYKKLSFNIAAEGGSKINERHPTSLDFTLGGYGNDFINNYVPFYGLDFLSVRDHSYTKVGFTFDWNFAKKNHLNFSGNFANMQGFLFDNNNGNWSSVEPNYSGYAVGYGLETIIGPVEFKYTWSPESDKNIWFINVGFWF